MMRATFVLVAVLAATACNRPSEFCVDEAANAESCDAPFDVELCESRVAECSRRHDDALLAYRDCLEGINIGICGDCYPRAIIDQCNDSVFGLTEERREAYEVCERAFRDAVRNNACEQSIVGCDVEVTSVGAAFMPLGFLFGIALRRRRRPTADRPV